MYINASTVKSSSDFFHNFETVNSRTSKQVHECFESNNFVRCFINFETVSSRTSKDVHECFESKNFVRKKKLNFETIISRTNQQHH